MEDDGISDAGTVERDVQGFRVLYSPKPSGTVRLGMSLWSPQLDLIAMVMTNKSIQLYRMNGQRVWTHAHKYGPDNEVAKIQWRPDGKMLALAYIDGSTRIIDVNNGKIMHTLYSDDPNFSKITCVGWVDNHSHEIAANHAPASKSTECTPQALFDLDIVSMMPKLSVLPSSSGPESQFTSKATIDTLINSITKDGAGSNVDVLLIGDDKGKILLNVFDSFLIGTMPISSLSHQISAGSKLLYHTASSDLSTHSLLISEPRNNKLLFSTMDILFIQQFGQYLFQLASTSTKIQALIRYMGETVKSLEAEFTTMNTLAQRYVGIIEEEIKTAGGEDSEVGLEFFEYLVTGIPSAALKEWLVDVLMERGQKRWEKSSTTGYEALRRLVHENLLPTCERLSVLFCRLRGLARWKESGSPLGLEPDDFTRCLDVVAGISLFSHEFLQKINKELDLFAAFNIWIKYALDQLSSIRNAEEEKQADEPTIDTLKVAEYVGIYLKSSSLQPFFKRDIGPRLSEYKERGESITDLYSKEDTAGFVPGFQELAEYLNELSKTVFSKPQQAMRQQLRIGKPLVVHEEAIKNIEIRMVSRGEKNPLTYMALHSGKNDEAWLVLVCCEIETKGGLSTILKVSCANLLFPSQSQSFVQVKFVDEKLLITILRDRETHTSEMLSAEYVDLEYSEYNVETSHQSVFTYGRNLPRQHMSVVSSRKYDGAWVPNEVIVNGEEGRRVGCVFAEDRSGCVIFDLDHDEEEDEEYPDETMEVDQYI